jgi:hypothetical protein
VLKLEGQIRDKRIIYLDPKANERFQEFKSLNDGSWITVVYESHNAVAYFQHKYFHGYVLPQICEAMGEKDQAYVKEFVLKEQYLYSPVSSYSEIPPRHRKRLRVITERIVDSETGEVSSKIVGYIPSTSVIDFKTMRDFILWCENLRDGLIDWSMKDRDDYDDMMKVRTLALNDSFERMVTGDSDEQGVMPWE